MPIQALFLISMQSVNSNWSQSGHSPFGSKSLIFRPLWPWNLTWHWKTTGHLFFATSSFVFHFVAICGFKLELHSRDAENWGKICFDLWPWSFAWTSHLSMAITPENLMMIQWEEHSEKDLTVRQMNWLTDWQSIELVCQLKTGNSLEDRKKSGSLMSASCWTSCTFNDWRHFRVTLTSIFKVNYASSTWN